MFNIAALALHSDYPKRKEGVVEKMRKNCLDIFKFRGGMIWSEDGEDSHQSVHSLGARALFCQLIQAHHLAEMEQFAADVQVDESFFGPARASYRAGPRKKGWIG